jgi:hypothetical protein
MMRAVSFLALYALACVSDGSAQSVRGTALSYVQYAQIRPITRDTVDSAQVVRTPGGRLQYNGIPVECAGAVCTFFQPADPQSALLFTQDVAMTAWGVGLSGLSATVLLRARADLGGEFAWPRYDDAFDAILAYAELTRERYRARAGRQRNVSGLGFTSFDGGSFRFAASDAVQLEVYGGRSLGRGLEEPRHSALDALEDFIPDENAILAGAAAEVNVGTRVASVLRYQTEFWADGSGLLAERASADVRVSRMGPFEAEAAIDFDVAFLQLGKSHVTLRAPLTRQQAVVEVTARRYRPFFELWTIWGFFSPIGYNEGELQARVRPVPWADISVLGALRQYDDTNAGAFLLAPQDRTVRGEIQTVLRLPRDVNVDVRYQIEHGFGAFTQALDASGLWHVNDAAQLGVYATTFQQILEFRTGNAIVFGLGAHGRADISDRVRIAAGATLYRQNIDNRPSGADWNQTRAWSSLEVTFGRDPGMAGGAR